MNRFNFNQTGGFPLSTNVLDNMQTAYALSNALGNLAGNFSIILGCEINGTTVADGVVYVNGELLEFRGGNAVANVCIKEDVESYVFEDGSSKPVLAKRYVGFGSSTPDKTFAWNSFYRPFSMKEIGKRLVHPGFIQDYFGDINKIPAGWFLCDGSNGTPDLREMFVVGYDPRNPEYDAIGKKGGLKSNTPTATVENANVSVTIPVTGYGTQGNQPDGNNPVPTGRLVTGSGKPELGEALESIRAAGNTQTVNASHTHNATINEIDNRPPYFVLAKIMYKG